MNVVIGPLAVDLALAVGAGAILLGDLVLPHGDKRSLGWATLAVVLACLVGTFLLDLDGDAVAGAYVGDPMATFLKQVFLASAAVSVLGSLNHTAEQTPRRQGEYYLLLLCSLLGMTLLAGVRDLLLLVVAFELMGIPLYVLAAWDKSDRAVEGSLKLYLTGALSSVTILLGLSFVFGLAGSTRLTDVAIYASAHPSPTLLLGGSIALAGMGFKVGVFPFHMWVPDAYEGSATPFVSFLSVAPKVAGIAALVQLLLASGGALLEAVGVMLIALATITMIMGNFLAINQSNVKRMLAYSGVAHIGFLLAALATGTELGLATLLFYAAGYLFTNAGTFLVVHAVAQGGAGRADGRHGTDSVASFDGLVQRSGWLASAMLLFLLSLAGIPFVVGFWAKLYVFLAAWAAGLGWLVVLGAVLSVLGLFYYLRIVRAMFMNKLESPEPIRADVGTNLGIAVCLVFVLGMGIVPRPFIEAATVAARTFLGG